MAQLWGGRFTKDTAEDVYAFNASINFDKRLLHDDIKGSRVHAKMLCRQSIITEEERDEILGGLGRMSQMEGFPSRTNMRTFIVSWRRT